MVNCYYLNDHKDLPDAFLFEGLKATNEIMVFGTLDGDDFSKYKIGNESENSDPHLMLSIF